MNGFAEWNRYATLRKLFRGKIEKEVTRIEFRENQWQHCVSYKILHKFQRINLTAKSYSASYFSRLIQKVEYNKFYLILKLWKVHTFLYIF